MGGFNIPMFILFIVVTIFVAAPLLYWSDLPNWVVLLLAPLASYAGLFAISQLIDLIEAKKYPDTEAPLRGEGRGTESDSAEEADFSLPEKPHALKCPSCGSKDIALILYGLPAIDEKLEKLIAKREMTLGGCGIYEGAPQWACNACSFKFGELRTREDTTPHPRS